MWLLSAPHVTPSLQRRCGFWLETAVVAMGTATHLLLKIRHGSQARGKHCDGPGKTTLASWRGHGAGVNGELLHLGFLDANTQGEPTPSPCAALPGDRRSTRASPQWPSSQSLLPMAPR